LSFRIELNLTTFSIKLPYFGLLSYKIYSLVF